mmetsp:Transcript_16708/g.47146  ORF Transcript_16708/g.47146 Transcript_16708/m.47146 type:complete len:89 (+) Transcript_16708:73-339(+)
MMCLLFAIFLITSLLFCLLPILPRHKSGNFNVWSPIVWPGSQVFRKEVNMGDLESLDHIRPVRYWRKVQMVSTKVINFYANPRPHHTV